MQSKPKRRGFIKGTRPGWKKAIVKLHEGYEIEIFEGAARLMPLKKYKPTSPGRRFMTVSGFDEVTKSEPEKSLLEPLTKKAGRNNRGRITTRHQGGGHKRRFRVDRLQAHEGRHPGEGRRDRVRPEPVGAHRAAPLRRRREGVHPRSGAASRRRDRRVGPRGGHQAGQRAPAREHPDGHDRALPSS